MTEKLSLIDKATLGRLKVDDLSRKYADWFRPEPWCEDKRCPACGSFFPMGSGGVCSRCGKAELVEAYPVDETSDYIRKEMAKQNARLAVQQNEQGVGVGFAWGYGASPWELAESKYATPTGRGMIVALLRSVGLEGAFYYISECGVDNQDRGRGFSNNLVGALIEQARRMGYPAITMRTMYNSPMVSVARRFEMEQVCGPTLQLSRNTVLRTGGYVRMPDPENEARVLFQLRLNGSCGR